MGIDDDIDAMLADITTGEDTDGASPLISLIMFMMYMFCSCYLVLNKVGSGNYDHSTSTTRAMRLRLPDVAGRIEFIGTRSYRLMNWTDVLYRSIHCDRNCLMQLKDVLTPWLLLPRDFSAGFFNPDNPVNTSIPLADWQAVAAERNPFNRGRPCAIDILGLIITFLHRVCTCSMFVNQAEANLVSMSTVHRSLEHVGWALCQALHDSIDAPTTLKAHQDWLKIPACIRAHFGLKVIWGALDNTLQVQSIVF
jgi:hypothetical protein